MLERCRSLLHVRHILILIIIAFLLHTNTLTKNLVLLTFGTSNSTCSTRVFNWNPSHILCRVERKGMIDKPIAVELTSSTFSRIIIVQIQILAFWTPPGRLNTWLRNWQVESHQFILCWIRWHESAICILNISFDPLDVYLSCFIRFIELHCFCLFHRFFCWKMFIKCLKICFICFVCGI